MSVPVYIPFATFLRKNQTTSNFWQVTTTTKHLLTTPSVLEYKGCWHLKFVHKYTELWAY